jgi:hypothetical protein
MSNSDPLLAWLEGLGFSRGNPFATAVADRERELLPLFFVDVDGYDEIKDNKRPVIAFAPEGGGKSALRVMLASDAAPLTPDKPTLAVEYTDFAPLVDQWRDHEPPSIHDHLKWLLRAAVKALLDTFCQDPDEAFQVAGTAGDDQQRGQRAAVLPAPDRSLLADLIGIYYPELLLSRSVFKRFRRIEPGFGTEGDWDAFEEAAAERRLRPMVKATILNEHPAAHLLAVLSDYRQTTAASVGQTPVEELNAFVSLARAAGFKETVFLVDRLDEMEETADDPEAQATILEPLLATLRVIELDGVAFKFFLSQEVRDALLARPTIRRDRITDHAVTIAWDRPRLHQLLKERIATYSDGKVRDLAYICQEEYVVVKSEKKLLAEWIEEEMLQMAQGSPRRLLTAGQLLLQSHYQRRGAAGLIEKADWLEGKKTLQNILMPLLEVAADGTAAWLRGELVHLSHIDQMVLQVLLRHDGRCPKELMMVEGWQGGNTLEGTEAAVKRLQAKIGEAYLEMGSGRKGHVRLKHFEIRVGSDWDSFKVSLSWTI